MPDPGVDLSRALVGAVREAGRSVVSVEGRARGASSGIAWSADGLVLTSHHALERDAEIRVGLPDGSVAEAVVVGRDPGTDLALLRAKGASLTPAAWSEEPAEVGQLALALTRPGRSVRASLGIVSVAGDAWRTGQGARVDRYLHVDVPLERGFSGGLFADAAGKGFGMASAGLRRGTALAIPLSTLRRVAEALLARGRVRRGYLGIGSYPVPLPRALAESLRQDGGLVLVSVQPDAPAARAGLLLGDVILKVEGAPATHPAALIPYLDEERVGSELTFLVLRAGAVSEMRVAVGARGAEAE